MIKAIFHIKTILLQLTYLKQFLLYFHKVKFSIDKLKAMISYPLESFNQTDKAEELKSEIKAIGKIGVKFSEIEEVTYQYMPVNCKKTLRELEIENGGILIIKLKPSF